MDKEVSNNVIVQTSFNVIKKYDSSYFPYCSEYRTFWVLVIVD